MENDIHRKKRNRQIFGYAVWASQYTSGVPTMDQPDTPVIHTHMLHHQEKESVRILSILVHPDCILCILKNEIHSKWPTEKFKNTPLLVLSTFLKI